MKPQIRSSFNIPFWLKFLVGLAIVAFVVYGAIRILNEGKTEVGVKPIKTEEQVSQSLTEVSTNVDDIKSRLGEIDKGLG